MEHGPVIFLGVLGEPGVLLGIEELIRGHPPVPPGVVGGPALQLHELGDHLVLARPAQAEARRKAVGLRVFAGVVEA